MALIERNLALGLNKNNNHYYTVMLVDDSSVVRMVLKRILLAESFEIVMEAENGKVAIEKLKKADKTPDFLLIDKEMPLMDGLSAIKEIHPAYPELKIIMFTGASDKETVKNAINLGISGYVVKPEGGNPFDRRELLTRIAKILGRADYCDRYINE
jgi:two-component system chemotaxis response regulator CheY